MGATPLLRLKARFGRWALQVLMDRARHAAEGVLVLTKASGLDGRP